MQPRRRLGRADAGATTARVHVLVPAHNEEAGIGATLAALAEQTYAPTSITVITDNCTDRTADIARAEGAQVVATVANRDKKAGALNQVLHELLPDLGEHDFVFVQDADSALDPQFLENAVGYLTRHPGLGAVGGTFRAQPPLRRSADAGASPVGRTRAAAWNTTSHVLRHLQDNEFARYARDVERLDGKCLVVTGTAAMFRATTLQDLSQARLDGRLPAGDGQGGIYDTTVLTEDNELSFAIMHLGYELLAPPSCTLTTEAMPTLRELWNQRLRWKRGAVENCLQYGLTSVTRPYWGRQLLTLIGVIVTFLYLSDVTLTLLFGSFHIKPFWIGVTLVFVLERYITLRDKPLRYRLWAMTLYELPYEFFLQATHAKAYLDSLTRTERKW